MTHATVVARVPTPDAGPTAVDYALAYAEAGYLVLPLHTIETPAPADVVERWRAGELSKKQAVVHARCTCGRPDCASPGKHPLTAHGARDASADPGVIRAWWETWPDANVGLRMPPGRVVLDFDLYEPGAAAKLDALAHSTWAPEVPTAGQTSGGGEHWVFTCPPDAAFQTSLDGQPGVDIIHAGHRYIVAEPSIHWTGTRYEWQTEPSELAPIPPALLARCVRGAPRQPTTPTPAGAPNQRAPGRYVGVQAHDPNAPVLICPAGVPVEQWATFLATTLPPAVASDAGGAEHGHVTLARAACHLIAGLGLDPPQAVDILWEYYNPRCDPPWDEAAANKRDGFEDFERTVLSAGRTVPSEGHGYLLPKVPQPWLGPAGPGAVTAGPRLEGEPHPLLRFGVLVDRTKPPEPLKYVYEYFDFAPGKVSAIQAYAYSAKTPFALQFTLCVAAGIPFLGHPVAQCNAVFAAFEGGWLAEEREARVAAGLGLDRAAVPLDFFKFYDFLSEEFVVALEDWVRTRQVGLVTIDTYGAAVPPGVDHNSSQFSEWLKRLGKLSDETGCLVVVLIHENKSADSGELRGVSGHNSLGGAVQAVVQLRRPGEDKTVLDVASSRAVRKPFETFRIKWRDPICPGAPTGFGLLAEVQAAQPNEKTAEVLKTANAKKQDYAAREDAENRADIMAWLKSHPFASARELIDHACGGARNSFYRVMKDLMKQGYVKFNGDLYSLAASQPTPAQAFLSRTRQAAAQ